MNLRRNRSEAPFLRALGTGLAALGRGLLLAAAGWTGAASAQGLDEADVLPVEQAFVPSASIAADGSLQVDFAIADGYYLYRERLKFSAAAPVVLGAPLLPSGQPKDDPNLGLTEVYHDALQATLAVEGGGADQLQLTLGYQGCAEAGLCYPPQKVNYTLDLPAGSGSTPASGASPAGIALLPGGSTNPGLALPGQAAPAAALVDDALPEDQAFRYEAIATDDHNLLVRFVMAPGYYLYRDKTELRLVGAPEQSGLGLPRWPAAETIVDDHFGEVAVYFGTVEVPLEVTRAAGAALPLTLGASFQGCKQDGICYPVMQREVGLELPAAATAHAARESAPLAGALAAGSDASPAPTFGLGALLAALLLAVAGGLVLNLMPCVLPVLSLKAIGLAESGRSHGHARAQALWYTTGVLVSFAAVGLAAVLLRNAGQALGWGFQLQQPGFVAALVLVMAVVGFSLSGIVSFGGNLMGVGQGLTEREGSSGAFFTGVLAVVVASPCTAPFMFGALGYAFAQPPAIALLVFLALGLGLALPFLLIGFIPALARRLPRPGAWMESFKQWMAFPMYLTAIWLLWVLGKQRGADAMGAVLVGALLLGAACWWWEKVKYGERGRRAAAGLALASVIGAAYAVGFVQQLEPPRVSAAAQAELAAEQGYEPYSPQRLAELLAAGTPVFVNMTADWCATCKVNEGSSLDTDAFRSALLDTGTVYLKGDWTNSDPQITAFLQRFNAVGVPLYVSFDHKGVPTVLPTVLTPGLVSAAVRSAGAPVAAELKAASAGPAADPGS